MSENDDDAPVLTYVSAEWTLDMVAESLKFGQNWEYQGKRETAADWVTHSKFTFQTHRQKESDKIIVPFERSKKKKNKN